MKKHQNSPKFRQIKGKTQSDIVSIEQRDPCYKEIAYSQATPLPPPSYPCPASLTSLHSKSYFKVLSLPPSFASSYNYLAARPLGFKKNFKIFLKELRRVKEHASEIHDIFYRKS